MINAHARNLTKFGPSPTLQREVCKELIKIHTFELTLERLLVFERRREERDL